MTFETDSLVDRVGRGLDCFPGTSAVPTFIEAPTSAAKEALSSYKKEKNMHCSQHMNKYTSSSDKDVFSCDSSQTVKQ